MKRYEGLFLFDTTVVREWKDIEEELRRLCSRIGAELLVCVKFDERKLAYEIKRRKRGTYVLAYFDAPGEKLGELERDVVLSEVILRALFLRADGLTDVRLAELKAHPAEQPLAPMAGEGRRHDDDRDRRYPSRGYDRDRGRDSYAPREAEVAAVPEEAAVEAGFGGGEER